MNTDLMGQEKREKLFFSGRGGKIRARYSEGLNKWVELGL